MRQLPVIPGRSWIRRTGGTDRNPDFHEADTSLYIGPTKDGNNKIEKGHQYIVRVTMNYYDNEKNVEVTSDPSDGFMMTSKGEVSLYYTWNEKYRRPR